MGERIIEWTQTSEPGSLVFIINKFSRYSGFPLVRNLPISIIETVALELLTNIMRIYSCRYSSGFTPDSLESVCETNRLLNHECKDTTLFYYMILLLKKCSIYVLDFYLFYFLNFTARLM